RRDVPSPLAPKNDAELAKDEGKNDDKKDEGRGTKDEGKSTNDEGAKDESAKDAKDKKDDGEGKKPAPVSIDLDGFEARVVVLPPKAGNYAQMYATKGKVVYRRTPRTGSADTKAALIFFDLEDRDEKTVLEDVDAAELTADGKKVLVRRDDKYAIVELKKEVKFEKPLRIDEMETTVDPRAEWRQMFADAYRFERDYFYDPNMHGVDWKATRDRYAALLDAAVTRWDVNFVLGEFIGELNASHTYRGGGDQEQAPERGVGMLGIDWELADGAYRVNRIVAGGRWDADARAPVAEPGANVKVGDYVLAVNGVPLDPHEDPWAAFGGSANDTVVLTVNKMPSPDGARQATGERPPGQG